MRKVSASLIFVCIFSTTPFLSSSAQTPLNPIYNEQGQLKSLHKTNIPAVPGITAKLREVPNIPSSYHFGTTLICSDCHVMHSSMEHNYSGTTSGEGVVSSFPWSTTPTAYLLKKANLSGALLSLS